MIAFDDRAPDVLGALVMANGLPVTLRIDARSAPVRLDARKPWAPLWEAIDNGDGFPDVETAKAYASRWVQAADAQRTLTPRTE